MDRIKSLFATESESTHLRTKNFPPCYPLMHHSLAECGSKKILCIMGMIHYAVFVFLLLTNFVGNFGLFLFGIKLRQWIETTLGSVIISGFWLVVLPIVVFFTGYLVTYKACTSSFFLPTLLFLISKTILIVFSVVMGLGVPNTGGFGLLSIILSAINASRAEGLYVMLIWALIQMVLWFGLAIFQFAMLVMGGLYLFSQDTKGSIKGALLRSTIRNIV